MYSTCDSWGINGFEQQRMPSRCSSIAPGGRESPCPKAFAGGFGGLWEPETLSYLSYA